MNSSRVCDLLLLVRTATMLHLHGLTPKSWAESLECSSYLKQLQPLCIPSYNKVAMRTSTWAIFAQNFFHVMLHSGSSLSLSLSTELKCTHMFNLCKTFKCPQSIKIYSKQPQTSKQANKHTHKCVHFCLASLGLTQVCLNYASHLSFILISVAS